jgi:type IV secretion system protein VirB5
MANPFKKETLSYKGEQPLTPYQRAQQEWDDRIGSGVVQAKNWRMIAFLAVGIAVLLLLLLLIVVATKRDRVFVAEVTTSGKVVNVMPLKAGYNPTVAQQEYFISQFIENIRSLPLDPVVAKQNWLKAYSFLSQRANNQLSELLRQQNPLELLGKKTITIKINDINPISESTFQVDWLETIFDSSGLEEKKENYSGVFSVVTKQPTTQQQILQNPLGIFIVDFHISTRS